MQTPTTERIADLIITIGLISNEMAGTGVFHKANEKFVRAERADCEINCKNLMLRSVKLPRSQINDAFVGPEPGGQLFIITSDIVTLYFKMQMRE